MSINVSNEVRVCEVEGRETSIREKEHIIVRSHWNRRDLVVLEVAGTSLAVAACDLREAVANVTNAARWQS